MTDFSEIPVIDIGCLRRGDSDGLGDVAAQIHVALTEVGFMYVTNHGIDKRVFDDAIETSRVFFHLPEVRKNKSAINKNNRGYNGLGRALMDGAEHPDDKEFFQIGLDLPDDDPEVLAGRPLRGANVWPEGQDGFRSALTRYFDEIGRVGSVVLRGVAASLGLPPDFFAARYAKPLQRTQVIYYPARTAATDPNHFGVAPHSDYGCMTLLYQDQIGGLHVLNKANEWIAAPPIEGSLVLNVGDLLERWSNNRFVSTKHMVRNRSGQERMSIATFYDPDFSALVDPGELALSPGEKALFDPVLAGDHIVDRIWRSIETGANK